MPEIGVIVATLGLEERAAELARCLDSITTQEGVSARAIVVLNGDRFGPGVRDWLRGRSDIRLVELERPSVMAARRSGRQAVAEPYFAFLDDDDEILPGGLAKRAAILEADQKIDVVSSNGFLDDGNTRQPHFADMEQRGGDLALEYLNNIWLNSVSGLYRSSSIGLDYLQVEAPLEWTLLALRLTVDRRIHLLEEFTFVRYMGGHDQYSESNQYVREAPAVIARMLGLPVSRAAKKVLAQRYSRALHALAQLELSEGRWRQAWEPHVRSLLAGDGYRYLAFTRHLLNPATLLPRGGQPT